MSLLKFLHAFISLFSIFSSLCRLKERAYSWQFTAFLIQCVCLSSGLYIVARRLHCNFLFFWFNENVLLLVMLRMEWRENDSAILFYLCLFRMVQDVVYDSIILETTSSVTYSDESLSLYITEFFSLFEKFINEKIKALVLQNWKKLVFFYKCIPLDLSCRILLASLALMSNNCRITI